MVDQNVHALVETCCLLPCNTPVSVASSAHPGEREGMAAVYGEATSMYVTRTSYIHINRCGVEAHISVKLQPHSQIWSTSRSRHRDDLEPAVRFTTQRRPSGRLTSVQLHAHAISSTRMPDSVIQSGTCRENGRRNAPSWPRRTAKTARQELVVYNKTQGGFRVRQPSYTVDDGAASGLCSRQGGARATEARRGTTAIGAERSICE